MGNPDNSPTDLKVKASGSSSPWAGEVGRLLCCLGKFVLTTKGKLEVPKQWWQKTSMSGAQTFSGVLPATSRYSDRSWGKITATPQHTGPPRAQAPQE